MRLAATVLLANLSLCGAAPTNPAGTASPPKVSQDLIVSAQPAATGQPIALRGRQSMMCALRKNAPTACIGEIGLGLEPTDRSRDDGRYARGHTQHPIAIDGLDFSHLEATTYTRCLYAPSSGPVKCWWRDAARREERYPEPLPFTDVRDVAAGDG